MRFSRTIVLAAAAAAAMFMQPVADAGADHRWHLQFGWPFADPGYYAPRPRYYYYEPEYYDPYYGDEEAYYDPDYDEPPPRKKKRAQRLYDDEYYDEPISKKKKKLSTAKVNPDPDPEEPAPLKKKSSTAKVDSNLNLDEPTAAKKKLQLTAAVPAKAEPKTAGGGVNCDKARTIIGEYGFTGITPTDCEGSELGFKAQRDGKSFSIKVSSLGELTEVKRQ